MKPPNAIETKFWRLILLHNYKLDKWDYINLKNDISSLRASKLLLNFTIYLKYYKIKLHKRSHPSLHSKVYNGIQPVFHSSGIWAAKKSISAFLAPCPHFKSWPLSCLSTSFRQKEPRNNLNNKLLKTKKKTIAFFSLRCSGINYMCNSWARLLRLSFSDHSWQNSQSPCRTWAGPISPERWL